jgi:L-ascorbate metabolism protein UlaG (beta-lactamase superfamily)
VVGDGDRLRFGDFEIVVHESRHFEFPDPEIRQRALGDPEIVEPLVPPVETFAYRVGVPLAVEIAHPRGTLLVQGSAGYVPGALSDVDVDVVLLGVGGLGSQTPEYREAYWRETVETTSPTRVIPIHWDDLTAPIDGPFRGSVRIASMLGGGDGETLSFLKEKERSSPDIQFLTLPRYDPVILY